MKRSVAFLFSLIGWFAVVTQFVLMVESTENPMAETVIRFFSFFTILTNIIVAAYFSRIALFEAGGLSTRTRPGVLTAITVYIFMVGIVYQVALRHLWKPEGLQMVVDELLHTIMPVFAIIFWALYEKKAAVQYAQILKWAIYPLAYLVFVLIRGSYSNFYPYPFVSVDKIGIARVLINSVILLLVFLLAAAVFVLLGKRFSKGNA